MKALITSLIILAILLPGCTGYLEPVSVPESVEETVPENALEEVFKPPISTPTIEVVEPTSTNSQSLYLCPSGQEAVVVTPAYFEFNTVSPSSTIDTWTSGGFLAISKQHKVTHEKEDLIYFIIHNDSVHNYEFLVTVEDAPDAMNWCETTQQFYSQAPTGAVSLLHISESNPTLQSGEIRTIPFSLQLNSSIEYPKQWEVRFSILRLSEEGASVYAGAKIRVFVYMK